MGLYAQGFSVTNYLVAQGGRQAFLGFVQMGLNGQWDKGVQTYYQLNSVEQLEQAWLTHLKETKGGGAAPLAQQTKPHGRPDAADGRLVVRQTVPPAQPQPRPVRPSGPRPVGRRGPDGGDAETAGVPAGPAAGGPAAGAAADPVGAGAAAGAAGRAGVRAGPHAGHGGTADGDGGAGELNSRARC